MMQSDRGNQFAPGKLCSLLEMMEFKLKPFFAALFVISSAQHGPVRHSSTSSSIEHQKEVDFLSSALERLRPELALFQVGGASLMLAFERLEKSNVLGGDRRLLEDYIYQFQRILNDELVGNFALMLSLEERRFYEQPAPLFGEKVEKAFQEASEDIAEAGKCLALGRSTAAVFHIMRAPAGC